MSNIRQRLASVLSKCGWHSIAFGLLVFLISEEIGLGITVLGGLVLLIGACVAEPRKMFTKALRMIAIVATVALAVAGLLYAFDFADDVGLALVVGVPVGAISYALFAFRQASDDSSDESMPASFLIRSDDRDDSDIDV